MAEGHVNRTVLSSYYQNPGDVYDDAKTEGAYEVLAQQIDDNYDAYDAHKTAAVLAHPDGSVTTAKIKDGAVTAAKLDPSIVVGTPAGLVQANLDAHKAETSQKHIHESGENANGKYIRFDDGTQICFRKVAQDFSTTGDFTYNYPASFLGNLRPEGAGGIWQATTSSTQISAYKNTLIMAATTNWRIHIGTAVAGITNEVTLFAIGRWK